MILCLLPLLAFWPFLQANFCNWLVIEFKNCGFKRIQETEAPEAPQQKQNNHIAGAQAPTKTTQQSSPLAKKSFEQNNSIFEKNQDATTNPLGNVPQGSAQTTPPVAQQRRTDDSHDGRQWGCDRWGMCRQLKNTDIGMREAVHGVVAGKGPSTYFKGSEPIDGI